jgi:ribosomal protein S19E (S16A)
MRLQPNALHKHQRNTRHSSAENTNVHMAESVLADLTQAGLVAVKRAQRIVQPHTMVWLSSFELLPKLQRTALAEQGGRLPGMRRP